MQRAEDSEPDRMATLLGRRMRKIRDARPGLSQEKLAQKAGTSRETVRRVEAGLETTTAMIDRLLWAMHADAEELLDTVSEDSPTARDASLGAWGLHLAPSGLALTGA